MLTKTEDQINIISLTTTAFSIFQNNIYKKYIGEKASKKTKVDHFQVSSSLPVAILYETMQVPSSSGGEQFSFKKTDRTTVSDESGSKNNTKIN